ncbi:hypothetical protein AVEN_200975-1 [Araneus ventricosus]|uniref:Uncharacterized protein n=1 Tax=Araneus ventricosus TaxID=182803 RepID=A0A4Y2TP97_ARAVE|nr:hypothetical protein AVEN_200975-1 [Araneus ventricosus]
MTSSWNDMVEENISTIPDTFSKMTLNEPELTRIPETVAVVAISKRSSEFCFRTIQQYYHGRLVCDWREKIKGLVQELEVTHFIFVGSELHDILTPILSNRIKFHIHHTDFLKFPCRQCMDNDCVFTKARLALRSFLKWHLFTIKH